MSEEDQLVDSPFDEVGVDTLEASVYDPHDPVHRLRGYAVGADLARHYRWSDVTYLTIVGELPPTDEAARAFELALVHAYRLPISAAVVHAARTARHVSSADGNAESIVAVAGIGLAEHLRRLLDAHGSLLDWLQDREGDVPVEYLDDARPMAELDELLPEGHALPHPQLTFDAAIVSVLFDAGLRERHQLSAALAAALLPGVLAEAHAVSDPRLLASPLNVPYWVYVPPEGGER